MSFLRRVLEHDKYAVFKGNEEQTARQEDFSRVAGRGRSIGAVSAGTHKMLETGIVEPIIREGQPETARQVRLPQPAGVVRCAMVSAADREHEEEHG